MSQQGWMQQMVAVAADGTAVANSAAQTSLLTGSPGASSGVWKMPANTLLERTTILIRAAGRISTVVTAPGTLTFTVKVGSVNACVSQAFALNTTAQVNQTWRLELELTARVVGSGTNAVFMFAGRWDSRAVLGSAAVGAGGVSSLLIPETAPAVGTGFDSTADQAIDLQSTWSIANASNSIQLHQYGLWLAN